MKIFRKIALIILSFLIIIVVPLKAQPVDTINAKLIAKNFFKDRVYRSKSMKARSFSDQDIDLSLFRKEAGKSKKGSELTLYYIYNVKDKLNPKNNKGFVIISADKRITPVLGYSFTGEFKDDDQPPAFKAWMDNYKEQISYIIRNDIKPKDKIVNDWQDYSGTFESKSDKGLTEVLPLITTTWNQDCYYNNSCPVDSTGTCNRALAGCVAIAMAQIMKYWNYPEANNPIPGYKSSNYGWINGVGETKYNWSHMSASLNSSSSDEEKNAISKIIYDCGVSVQMGYGPSSSGSYPERETWINYFKYSPGINYVYRHDYSDGDWAAVLKKELDSNRPVSYIGYNDAGGHAFVSDGYQDDNCFHFNWGWGGYMDGYFYIDNLTSPSNPFMDNQLALIGISPVSEISVAMPVGGENWQAGSSHNITWISSGTSGTVRIQYSINNGTSWSNVVLNTPDDGSYSWTVPDEPSANCRIRVTDSDNDPSDISDAVFTILSKPSIYITMPVGGENWQTGSSHNITWISSDTSRSVRIQYSINNGLSWNEIISGTPNDGSYLWIVPVEPSINCLVSITDSKGALSDVSDNVFVISKPPAINVISPDGGENWQAGTGQNIIWNSQGTSGSVRIEFSLNKGTSWNEIISSTPDDGVYTWSVPNSPSVNCLIRINDVKTDIADKSSSAFTVFSTRMESRYSPASPIIDGNIVPSEWSEANQYHITFSRMDAVNTSEGFLYLQNDDTYLYLGLTTFFDAGANVNMSLKIDGNNDNLLSGQNREPHTDISVQQRSTDASGAFSGYGYLTLTGSYATPPPSGTKSAGNGTSDVNYEFRLKLSDLNMNDENVFGFQLFNSAEDNPEHAYIYPSNSTGTNPSNWDHIKIGITTNIVDKTNDRVKIYPVPAKDFLTIDLGNAESKETKIEIIDLSGILLYKEIIRSEPYIKKELNLSALRPGYYLVKIMIDNNTYLNKLIIE